MKIKSIMLIASIVSFGQFAHAGAAYEPTNKPTGFNSKFKDVFGQSAAELIYGYTDFHFKSDNGTSYNTYNGSSNLYSVGADRIKLASNFLAGLYLFRINTSLNSETLIAPSSPSSSSQTVSNNTIFGHVFQTVSQHFFIDYSGGYGQNSISTFATVLEGTSSQTSGVANYDNFDWLASINGIYKNSWKKVLLTASLGVLYTQVSSNNAIMSFESILPEQLISPLTTKSTLIIQNLELGYQYNTHVMPFINAALIEVAQYTNSRPLLFNTINGSLPQLDFDLNAYRVGGGFTFSYKQFSLRVEEKYYNASGTFDSLQTLVGLECQFS